MYSDAFLFHRNIYHKVAATKIVDAKIKYQTYTDMYIFLF